MEPLLATDEAWGPRTWRRARGIGLEVLVFVLITVCAPVLVIVTVTVDCARWLGRRTPWVATRLLATVWWFVYVELWGLVALARIGFSPIRRGVQYQRRAAMLTRQRWLIRHFRGVRAIFGLDFQIEGLDRAGGGPIIILIRHASSIDTLLPDAIIGREHGTKFRYVLKRELLALPTIDIGRRWVPTVFVSRGAGGMAALARIRMLATALPPDQGIVIYPEGAFFSPAKLERAQKRIAARRPSLAPIANRFSTVLPPQIEGTKALLEAAPDADVLLCGHRGLEPFESARDMWRGTLVGATVHVKFWRFSAAEVPRTSDDELAHWLFERWLELDEWIGQSAAATVPLAATTAPSEPAD